MILSAVFSLFFSFSVNAQQTGKIEYPSLGISFTIPDGWVGYETEDAFLMGSETIAGLIILTLNDLEIMDELRREALSGISEGPGTELKPVGEIENIGIIGLSVGLEGMLEGNNVKGYAAGILNQFGSGVPILVLTSPEVYSDIHKETCLWLTDNIEFSRPVEPPVDEEWKNILVHARLTYLSSYSTSGGGSSSEANIHLCREGHFKYTSSSSTSLDVGGVFG
jgi:hypothetical protein